MREILPCVRIRDSRVDLPTKTRIPFSKPRRRRANRTLHPVAAVSSPEGNSSENLDVFKRLRGLQGRRAVLIPLTLPLQSKGGGASITFSIRP